MREKGEKKERILSSIIELKELCKQQSISKADLQSLTSDFLREMKRARFHPATISMVKRFFKNSLNLLDDETGLIQYIITLSFQDHVVAPVERFVKYVKSKYSVQSDNSSAYINSSKLFKDETLGQFLGDELIQYLRNNYLTLNPQQQVELLEDFKIYLSNLSLKASSQYEYWTLLKSFLLNFDEHLNAQYSVTYKNKLKRIISMFIVFISQNFLRTENQHDDFTRTLEQTIQDVSDILQKMVQANASKFIIDIDFTRIEELKVIANNLFEQFELIQTKMNVLKRYIELVERLSNSIKEVIEQYQTVNVN